MARSIASGKNLVDLYLRLSIDREGKDSLERQEADLREWAAREGLTVRRVWRDAGKSGYAPDVKRPDFDAAIAALKAGEVSTLAVWKLDRLSRQGAGQVGLVLDAVAKVGGRIVFLKDSLDTSAPGSRPVIVLVSELARAESENTSLRVRSTKDAARSRGEWLGGPAPFGYIVDESRKLRAHPTEFALAREVVERVLAGETLLTICRDWNTRGVPARRGEWRTSTLSAMLRSPALAGLMPDRRKDDDGNLTVSVWRHPATGEPVSLLADGEKPIATEAEQARLLAVMDSRLRRYGRGLRAVKQPKSLLGGLIHCASCGRSANTFGNSYRCRRWHSDGNDCPAPLSVRVELIEDAVKRAWATGLAALEPDSPILAAVADRWLQRFDPEPLRERDALTADLADARARLAAADDDRYVRGTLDAERHARVTAGLQDRISAIVSRLNELPQPEADLGALLDPEISLPAIQAAPVEEARELLRLAIRRVDVTAALKRGARFHPHERIRIRWVGEPD